MKKDISYILNDEKTRTETLITDGMISRGDVDIDIIAEKAVAKVRASERKNNMMKKNKFAAFYKKYRGGIASAAACFVLIAAVVCIMAGLPNEIDKFDVEAAESIYGNLNVVWKNTSETGAAVTGAVVDTAALYYDNEEKREAEIIIEGKEILANGSLSAEYKYVYFMAEFGYIYKNADDDAVFALKFESDNGETHKKLLDIAFKLETLKAAVFEKPGSDAVYAFVSKSTLVNFLNDTDLKNIRISQVSQEEFVSDLTEAGGSAYKLADSESYGLVEMDTYGNISYSTVSENDNGDAETWASEETRGTETGATTPSYDPNK